MAHYGFAIDLRKCIGCHACTIACKSEHDIPVGVNRCWVKTVEKGTFPLTQRLFFPVLCNQCDDAPCMEICPTSALFRRRDGIVDLNGESCIGCRACMAACPYDQLFIDPNTRTAEKCNFCANRIENKLEPACVSVCPTECRIFGDLDDPTSEVAQIVQREAFMVRKPEKGTGPKIFYLGADEAAMRPEIATRPFMFKEGQVKLRPIGSPEPDPERPGDARVDYDVPHKQAWGFDLALYLLFKGVSTGAMFLSALFWLMGDRSPLVGVIGPIISVLFAMATAVVLVVDLERPERFYLIMTRPNWSSWLARGAFLLTGHSGVASLWVLMYFLGWTGALSWLAPIALLLALAATAYTGFLFAQGLARDLWQGAHNTIDLIAQAGTEGSAAMLLAGGLLGAPSRTMAALAVVMALGALAHVSILLLEHVLTPSPTRQHELVVHAIRRGPYSRLFWVGAVGLGGAAPVLLVWLMLTPAIALSSAFVIPAAVFALAGGFAWEYIWVDAGAIGAEFMTEFRSHPPTSDWDDFVDFESKSWPKKDRKHYWIIPSICFNCESACGILAYVDKETLEVRKIEGNPVHPGSRGRTCAKGVVTPNQLEDPDRVLYPLKRTGARGAGEWKRVTWDEALDDLGGRIRRAITEGRKRELMYHVGRPGEDGYANRVLQSWGLDGHNSHTNVCSASARLGHFVWTGADRPSPDYANAKTILLLSSHLESGHYFNPHAQRIIEGKSRGARLVVIDPRLSNTSAKADLWLPANPGTEAALILAIARELLLTKKYNREFVRRWVNWDAYLEAKRPDLPRTFESFEAALLAEYATFTPEYAAVETGVSAAQILEAADAVASAGTAFATHSWRAAAAGHLWGWQITRCLYLLVVLMGAIGEPGGVNLHVTNKFVPKHFNPPPPPDYWNELLFPKEFPLAFFEMSFLLPHFLKEGRGKLDTYFTRVYNPLWTNPDGFTWMEVLRDESKIGMHVALTPIWSETAWFADYVLPMGLGTERHDTMSQETHAGRWLGFRQPVTRVAMEKQGKKVDYTHQANPGEVWEESEFWVALSWRIDPDGSMGIRKFFESPYRPGERITADEYYGWIFENSVPGLPEAAAKESVTPLQYMRKYGVFKVDDVAYSKTHEQVVDAAAPGIDVDGVRRSGFNTPSRRLEFFSPTLAEWGWPEHAIPNYTPGHVYWRTLDRAKHEFDLLPNFRLPTLIHTRSPVKWLYEISHNNPLWMATPDAATLGLAHGDLVKVRTGIGHFVTRVWITEGIRPGVVGMSHHLGRWRLNENEGGARVATSLVKITNTDGRYEMRQIHGTKPFESKDPDSARVWWSEIGVHQNITFPVQPDPVSGMHCWHQRVTVEKAGPDDRYGDINVDTNESHRLYKEWMTKTRPAPGPDGTRRPYWFDRPLRPVQEAYKLE